MSYRTVDIRHACGYSGLAHKIELGKYVKHDSVVSVEDHLRVRHCPKCGVRAGWTWTDPVVHSVAPVAVHVKQDAKPKP